MSLFDSFNPVWYPSPNHIICKNTIEAISKNGFWFKIKAAVNIKPEEYIRYFEALI